MQGLSDSGVLILHNLAGENESESSRGVYDEVNAASSALDALGVEHRIAGVRRMEDVTRAVSNAPERLVFNFVEELEPDAGAASFVPAVCEAFGRSCTGSPAACLSLTRDKAKTKAVLGAAGIPVPPGLVVRPGEPLRERELPDGPFIVKPACADASEGINAETSVMSSRGAALRNAVRKIWMEFNQPALIEKLVGTREINVSVIQRGERLEVMPIAEIDFSAFRNGQPRILDYAAKWDEHSFAFKNTPRIIPAKLPRRVARRAKEMAVAAWYAVGCADYARVDFRLDEDGSLYLLEVNANPDISPDAGFAAALKAQGLSFAAFVDSLLKNSVKRERARLSSVADRQDSGLVRVPVQPVVRSMRKADRDRIMEIVGNVSVFNPDEIAVAREVLGDSIEKGRKSGYISLVAEIGGRVSGWICFGHIPGTMGSYDIYWLTVDSARQNAGVGSALINQAEEMIRHLGGLLVFVDTSGRTIYETARRFYRKSGYSEASRVPGFYAPGDDKIIFLKSFQ